MAGEFFGEVFVVVAEEVGVGGVVESDGAGVVMDAEVEAGQEGAGEAGGFPGVEGGPSPSHWPSNNIASRTVIVSSRITGNVPGFPCRQGPRSVNCNRSGTSGAAESGASATRPTAGVSRKGETEVK